MFLSCHDDASWADALLPAKREFRHNNVESGLAVDAHALLVVDGLGAVQRKIWADIVLQKEVDEFFRDQRKIGLDAVLVVDTFQLLLHEGENLTVVVDAPQQRLAAMPNEGDLLARMGFSDSP